MRLLNINRKLRVDESKLNNIQEVKIDERIVFSRRGGCRVYHLPDKETFWILRITREFNPLSVKLARIKGWHVPRDAKQSILELQNEAYKNTVEDEKNKAVISHFERCGALRPR